MCDAQHSALALERGRQSCNGTADPKQGTSKNVTFGDTLNVSTKIENFLETALEACGFVVQHSKPIAQRLGNLEDTRSNKN